MARNRLTNMTLTQVNQMRGATQAARLASAMLGSAATDDQLTVAGRKILAGLGTRELDKLYRVASSLRMATGEQFPIDADSEGTESTDTPAFVTAKNVIPDRGILDVVTKERKFENKLTAGKSRTAAEDADDEVEFEDLDDAEPSEEEDAEDHVDGDDEDYEEDGDEDEDAGDDEDYEEDGDEDEDDFDFDEGEEDGDEDADDEDYEGGGDDEFTMEDADELHDLGVDGALTDGGTKKASRRASKVRREKERKSFVPKRTRVASRAPEVNEFDSVFFSPDISDAFAD